MYCKQCGKEYVTNEAVICVECGAPKGTGMNYCYYCGKPLQEGSTLCMNCGVQNAPTMQNQVLNNVEQKSKIAAGLLGIFLGSLGIHNFYLGNTNRGLIQLLVCLIVGPITCGIASIGMWIWGLVEGILILTGSINTDAKGIPLRD